MKKAIKYLLFLFIISTKLSAQNIVMGGFGFSTIDSVSQGGFVGQFADTIRTGTSAKIYEGRYHYCKPKITTLDSLSNFSTSKGITSSIQKFYISGYYLQANITITPPAGYEIKTKNGATYSTSLNLSPTNNKFSDSIYVRISSSATAGNQSNIFINISSTNAITKNIKIPLSTVYQPIIYVSSLNLDSLITTVNNPSKTQKLIITSNYITDSIAVTCPTGYEISLKPTSNFKTTTIKLPSVGDTIWVRVPSKNAATIIPQTTFTLSSVNASDVIITILKSKIYQPIIYASTLNLDSLITTVNNPSKTQKLIITSNYITDSIAVTCPTGYEISLKPTSNFKTTTIKLPSIGDTIWVRVPSKNTATTIPQTTFTISNTNANDVIITILKSEIYQPIIISNTSTIGALNTTVNNPSNTKTVSITSKYITDIITVTCPTGYEISTDGSLFKTTDVTLPSIGGNIWLRVPSNNKATTIPQTTFKLSSVNASDVIITMLKSEVFLIKTPTISTNIINNQLDKFYSYINKTSAIKTISITGTDLTDSIIVSVPAGFEIATDSNKFVLKSVKLSPLGGNLFIRIPINVATKTITNSNFTIYSNGASSQIINISTSYVYDIPTLSVNKTALNKFTSILGQNSSTQSFTITSGNLQDKINIKKSSNYEISLDSTSYKFTSNDTSVVGNSVNVWVRINKNHSKGIILKDSIVISSKDADSKTVIIPNGEFIDTAKVNINNALVKFNTIQNDTNNVQYFVINNNNSGSSTLLVNAPNNFVISTSKNSGFQNAITLNSTNKTDTIFIKIKNTTIINQVITDTIIYIKTNNVIVKTITIPGGSNVIAKPKPTLVSSTSTISKFSTENDVHYFTINGSNLESGIDINAPKNYKISYDSSKNYSNSISLPLSGTKIDDTKIFVKTNDTLQYGIIEAGQIKISSKNADTVKVNIEEGKYIFTLDKDTVNKTQISVNETTLKNASISFRYRKIDKDSTWQDFTDSLISTKVFNNIIYSYILNENNLGDIGIEYYYKIIDFSGKELTKTTIFPKYANLNNTTKPIIKGGTSVKNYQIVSFPFDVENSKYKKVSDVLKDWGNTNHKNWRMFSYNATTQKFEELNGDSLINNGVGYFLISKNNNFFPNFSAISLKVSLESPFEAHLKVGWNLVGNPYNFNLKIQDILNKNIKINNIHTYNEKYINADSNTIIKPFSGFFVYADTISTIKFPVIKNTSIQNLRLASNARVENQQSNIKSDFDWQVIFSLTQNDLENNNIGIGMHPNADTLLDNFDRISLPKFSEFLNLKAIHNNAFNISLSKDIAPFSENKTWNFDLECNNTNDLVNINWEQPTQLTNNIYLIDNGNNKIIDLKNRSHYAFVPKPENKSFRVIIGDKKYLEDNLTLTQTSIISLSPIPANSIVNIDYYISENEYSKDNKILIKDLTGNTVIELNGLATKGYNSQKINISNLNSGMYILELNTGNKAITQKIIKY